MDSKERIGYLYLHRELKKLIYKHPNYEFEGDLVQRVWPLTSDKLTAYVALKEAKKLGAINADEFYENWRCSEAEEHQLRKRAEL